MRDIQRLALVGGGLIGGSLSLALQAHNPALQVALYDIDPMHRAAALQRGIAHQAFDRLDEALKGADCVVVATPVASIDSTLKALPGLVSDQCLITDVGSTKVSVIRAARASLGDHFARFVPGHPIAGAETSGPEAARPDLFVGRRVVLTPEASTDPEATESIAALWRMTGAEIHVLDPEVHDQIFAAVSHLPHLLSYALVDLLARRPTAETLFDYAAGGFRDFTRIAASNPSVWRDITLANQAAILTELSAYIEALETLKTWVEQGRGDELQALYARAQAARLRKQTG